MSWGFASVFSCWLCSWHRWLRSAYSLFWYFPRASFSFFGCVPDKRLSKQDQRAGSPLLWVGPALPLLQSSLLQQTKRLVFGGSILQYRYLWCQMALGRFSWQSLDLCFVIYCVYTEEEKKSWTKFEELREDLKKMLSVARFGNILGWLALAIRIKTKLYESNACTLPRSLYKSINSLFSRPIW